MMRKSILLLGLAVPLITTAAAMAPATDAAAATTIQGDYSANNVNIRSGPHVTSTALGQGSAGDGVTLSCYVTGDSVGGDTTWLYLTDNRTSVTGYSADYYISWSGTLPHC